MGSVKILPSSPTLYIEPSDCVVVEDAKVGIQAAKAAGMTAFAMHGDAEGCGLEDYSLRSFEEMLNVLSR